MTTAKSKTYETLKTMLEANPETKLKHEITELYNRFVDELLPIVITCRDLYRYADLYSITPEEQDTLHSHINYNHGWVAFSNMSDEDAYGCFVNCSEFYKDFHALPELSDILSGNHTLFRISSLTKPIWSFNFITYRKSKEYPHFSITPTNLYWKAYEIIHQTYNWLTEYIDTMILPKHAKHTIHTPMTDKNRIRLLRIEDTKFLQDKCDYLFTQYTDVLVPLASDCRDLIGLLTTQYTNSDPSVKKMLDQHFTFNHNTEADSIKVYAGHDFFAKVILYADSKAYSLDDFHQTYSTGWSYFRASTSSLWFTANDGHASFPCGDSCLFDIEFTFKRLAENYKDTLYAFTEAHDWLTDYIENDIMPRLAAANGAA